MIKVEFLKNSQGDFTAYSSKGHSALATKGEDIVCAAVSTMTNLLLRFSDGKSEFSLNKRDNSLRIDLDEEISIEEKLFLNRIFEAFLEELKCMAAEYPKNLAVELISE